MGRDVLPFVATDISSLARSLRRELKGRADPPGHV